MISIVAALPEEVRYFCRCHDLERHAGDTPGWMGSVAGRKLEVRCTGVGARKARASLDQIVDSRASEVLIFVGSAGALTGSLKVGDLLVADRFVSSVDPTDVKWASESRWFARAAALAKARVGPILTTPEVVSSAEAKRELALRHALERENAAVDMESHAWATLAIEAKIPFVVLRAISDTVDEDLPLDFNDALRSDGTISRARVVAAALRHPTAVPGLLGLRDRVNLCSRVLEQALVSLLG